MYRILIIEDDLTIGRMVKEHLEKWNYEVQCVTDFQRVMEKFAEFSPQLVLLDVMLPFYNGFHWCQEIRRVSKIPVIFLSSANDNMNIVMAMNMGGDEFIEKPFNLDVLTAKIQAVLRRTYAFRGETEVLECGGVILNLGETVLSWQNQKIELTRNEFRILKILMEQAGHVVSRDRIMEKLWESDEFIDDNTLTVNVARLRKKLEQQGLRDFIQTKKGIGYMVTA